jgi:hypothetical protein
MKKFFNEKLWNFETAKVIAVGYAVAMVILVSAAVVAITMM